MLFILESIIDTLFITHIHSMLLRHPSEILLKLINFMVKLIICLLEVVEPLKTGLLMVTDFFEI